VLKQHFKPLALSRRYWLTPNT